MEKYIGTGRATCAIHPEHNSEGDTRSQRSHDENRSEAAETHKEGRVCREPPYQKEEDVRRRQQLVEEDGALPAIQVREPEGHVRDAERDGQHQRQGRFFVRLKVFPRGDVGLQRELGRRFEPELGPSGKLEARTAS
jgi:hypothetical protein